MPYQLSAEQIAHHLSWALSNSNHEIEPDGGPFLEVAFNAWHDGDKVTLGVSTFDVDTREHNEQEFTLTIAGDRQVAR